MGGKPENVGSVGDVEKAGKRSFVRDDPATGAVYGAE